MVGFTRLPTVVVAFFGAGSTSGSALCSICGVALWLMSTPRSRHSLTVNSGRCFTTPAFFNFIGRESSLTIGATLLPRSVRIHLMRSSSRSKPMRAPNVELMKV